MKTTASERPEVTIEDTSHQSVGLTILSGETDVWRNLGLRPDILAQAPFVVH